jgi:hypothetical protein
MPTRLVHLVWAPLGTAPLERFLAAYAARDAGRAHALTAVMNGFSSRAAAAAHERLLAEVPHDALWLERPVQDLAAYAVAARRTAEPVVAFVNSFSRPLADGWLELLCAPLADPDVGAVSASASYESHLTSLLARGRPRSARAAADLVRHAALFPRFPDPSLRTNALAIAPALFAGLAPRRLGSKFAAHAFESGRRGLTAQLRRRGLRPVVAGRDGRVFDIADWSRSATFRAGGQANLLVADNRTDDWERATSEQRARLTRMAWGEGVA